MKNTIKTLLIILSILSINTTLAKNDDSLHSDALHDILDPPNTTALNIMTGALSSLKDLRDKGHASLKNVKELINVKLLPNIAIADSVQFILKNHWDNLDNEQKQLFQRYVTQSLIKDYASALSTYQHFEDIHISADPEVKRKGNKAIVKLLITFDDNSKFFKVTLNMIHSHKHWLIYDVRFSGVSIIKTYRAQFNSHIRRKGLDSLVEKITRKLAKG